MPNKGDTTRGHDAASSPSAPMPRKALTKRLRYEILRRDNHTCRYCHATDTPLTIDHVIPAVLGGTDEPSNLVAACKDCNAGKTSAHPDDPLVEGVADDAIRWAKAMKDAAEIQARQLADFNAYCQTFYDRWDPTYALDGAWRASLHQWYSIGIELDFLLDCLSIALAVGGIQGRWEYFCGVTWKRIRERQKIAAELISGEAGA